MTFGEIVAKDIGRDVEGAITKWLSGTRKIGTATISCGSYLVELETMPNTVKVRVFVPTSLLDRKEDMVRYDGAIPG